MRSFVTDYVVFNSEVIRRKNKEEMFFFCVSVFLLHDLNGNKQFHYDFILDRSIPVQIYCVSNYQIAYIQWATTSFCDCGLRLLSVTP